MIGGDSGAVRAGKAFVEILADDLGLKAGLDRASARMRSWAATTSKIGLGLIGAGAAIVGPLLLAGKQTAKFGDDLNDIATRTGLSIDAITGLAHAAELSSSSFEDVEVGVKKMQVAIAAAAKGNKQAVAAFDALGISVADLLGLTPEQQIGKIADALLTIEDPGMRAAAAVKILGKAGTGLLPMLAGGSAGLKAFNDEAERLGLVTAARAASQVGDVDDSIASLTEQFGALKTVIGAAVDETIRPLLTHLQPIVAGWIEWADQNRGLVASLLLAGTALIGVGGAMLVAGVSATILLAAIGDLIVVTKFVGPLLLSAFTSPISSIRLLASTAGALATPLLAAAGLVGSLFTSIIAGGSGLAASLLGSAGPAIFGAVGSIATGVAGIALDGALAPVSAVLGVVPLILAGIGTLVGLIGPLLAEAFATIDILLSSALLSGLFAVVPAIGSLVAGIVGSAGLLVPLLGIVAAAAGVYFLAKLGASIGGIPALIGDALAGAWGYIASLGSMVGRAFGSVGSVVSSAFGAATSALSSSVSETLSFLSSIPGMAAGAFGAIVGYGQQGLSYLVGLWGLLKATAMEAWGGVVAAIGSGDFALAAQIAMSGLKLAWAEMAAYLGLSWTSFKTFFVATANEAWGAAAKGWAEALATITGGWSTAVKFMGDLWGGFKSLVRDTWNAVIDTIVHGLLRAQSLMPGAASYQTLKGQYDHDRKAEDQKGAQDDVAAAAARQAQYDAEQAARKLALAERLAAIDKEAAANAGKGDAARKAEADRLAAERDKAQRELDDLVGRAKSGAGLGGLADADNAIANRNKKPAFNFDDLKGAKDQFESRGQFGAGFGTQALNVPAFSKLTELAERTADATERTATATENFESGLDTD